MGVREDAGRYLSVIDRLLRRGGSTGVGDVAEATGLTFGKACALVSHLDRDRLVRHLPRSGIFITERGRALLLDAG